MSIAKRRENIQKSIEELETTLAILKKYASDSWPSKEDIAKELGITTGQITTRLQEWFKTAPANTFKKFSSHAELYMAASSASANLLAKAIGVSEYKAAVLPPYDEDYFWNNWLPSVVTERECRVLKKYYLGFDQTWENAKQNTVSAVAKSEDVSYERINQIMKRAMRRIISSRAHIRLLFPDADEPNGRIAELKAEIAEKRKAISSLEEEIKALDNILGNISDKAEGKSEAMQMLQKTKDMIGIVESTYVPETPIQELDLTVRSYNCLIRARLTTAEEVGKFGKEKLMKLRNFGKQSYEEVESVLLNLKPPVYIED